MNFACGVCGCGLSFSVNLFNHDDIITMRTFFCVFVCVCVCMCVYVPENGKVERERETERESFPQSTTSCTQTHVLLTLHYFNLVHQSNGISVVILSQFFIQCIVTDLSNHACGVCYFVVVDCHSQ